MTVFIHSINKWATTTDLKIPGSGTVTAVVSLASLSRINFLARVDYAATGKAGVAITEIYGTDLAWGPFGSGLPGTANPIFDNNTAAFARGSVIPPGGSLFGILQWNFDLLIHPMLIQFSLQNLDATIATFNLYGDVN